MTDARGHVNAHTHLYSGLAGLGMPAPHPAPSDFVQILERVWWRLDRALDASILRASARYYVAEALGLGTTALIDHHESPNFIDGSLDILAEACQELGMRALLCYGATERNGGREEAAAGLAECRRFLKENDRPLVRGVVGLHASFTVGDDTLREAGELCREFETVMHVHVAEDIADVRDAEGRGWPGPLERLLSFDCLPAGSILAHGVCLNEQAVRECERRGLWLVQNPRSNENNGVGHPRFLGASREVALGSDGFSSAMDTEEGALLALPIDGLESEACRKARLPAGHRLIAQHFDGVASSINAGSPTRETQDSILEEAQGAARRLWERMNDIHDS